MHKNGISVIEIMVAIAVFMLVSISVFKGITFGYRNISYDKQYIKAVFHAQEGLEAIRSLRDDSWGNLSTGDYGLILGVNGWSLVDIPQKTDGFLRQITISSVYRDSTGNISESGTILDPDVFKIDSTVTWEWLPGKQSQVVFSTYLTEIR